MTLLDLVYFASFFAIFANMIFTVINKDVHSFLGWMMAFIWFMYCVAVQ